MLMWLYLPADFSAYPTKRASGRSRSTGKGNETIEKTRKNSPYLLCQHSDFGADNAAGCAERDGRSPAKLHRQSVVRSHGGTGKVRYKKETNADKIYLVANHRGVDSFYGFDGLAL